MATRIRGLLWLLIFSAMAIAAVPSVGESATTYTWYGGWGNWETALKWTPGHVPNSITDDNANVISSGGVGYACSINSNISVLVPTFGIGSGLDTDTPCTVNIKSGASLTTGSELIISLTDNSYAVTNVYGIANLASLRMASTAATKAILNIMGGSVTVATFGTYIATDFSGISTNGNAQINISGGGLFTINGMGATGNRIDLGATAKINLQDASAVMKVLGNQMTLLQGYISAGKIIGSGGVFTYYNAVDGYTYVGVQHNVKIYGATGDGVTDDTVAIQAAINDATATAGRGETVFFPAGQYKLTATLTIPATSSGVNLTGEGRTRSILYRNTDYGDTMVIGSAGVAATEDVTITDLWFLHDYGGYDNGQPPSTMVNKPTSGAHVTAYGLTHGKIRDCQFWNMPCQLHFYGGASNEVAFCNMRGVWDHQETGLQVTTENIFFEKHPLGQVPTDFYVLHNHLTGYLSPSRPVTYGTWTGDVAESIGALVGIRILAGEAIQIKGGEIGGMNDAGVAIHAYDAVPNLNIYMSGIFFDNNRLAGVRITNEHADCVYNVHINDNTFIGEENSDNAIWVGYSTDIVSAVTSLLIQNNTFTAYCKTPIVVNSGRGVTISDNQIRDYDVRGGFVGDRFNGSAMFIGAAAYKFDIPNNTIGGGNGFEAYGAPFNECEYGTVYHNSPNAVYVSNAVDWGVNPANGLTATFFNWLDLTSLLDVWLNSSSTYDFNGNSIVDFGDYSTLIKSYVSEGQD